MDAMHPVNPYQHALRSLFFRAMPAPEDEAIVWPRAHNLLGHRQDRDNIQKSGVGLGT